MDFLDIYSRYRVVSRLFFIFYFHFSCLLFFDASTELTKKTTDSSVKRSIFTESKMDRQLLQQKVRQRISVMKTNKGVFVVFKSDKTWIELSIIWKPQKSAKMTLSLVQDDLVLLMRISANSFRGNYSFLKVRVRQLFKGGNY